MTRVVLLAVLVGACRREPTAAQALPVAPRTERAPGDEAAVRLGQLARAADQHPDDVAARKASGLAHMWSCLGGELSLRDRAELDLEAAFALDPSDRDLTRALGRFYNLRAVAGDSSKADRQAEVYRAHLGDTAVAQLSHSQLTAWSFAQLGVILAQRNRGRLLDALRTIEALERELDQRVAADPDDLEMRALAGNFSFFFAGNVPLQRRRRVEQAVAHFEVLRARWDQLRAGARDAEHCPNTRENYMFELAEGYLVLERTEPAAAIYRELGEPRPPITPAKLQIAQVAGERLGRLGDYAGRMELMPPWPGDVANCVVCHTHDHEVPTTSLYVLAR